jgi:predicted lipase
MDKIIVSIRGTDNDQGPSNWFANVDTIKMYPFPQHPDIAVHEGFYQIWQSIKSMVLDGIREVMAEHGPKTVHFTGHSMGGAVATDAALDLALNHNLTVGAYTYGSPRAGDYEYAMAVKENFAYHYRITHKDDPVPHLPPQALGFYHPPWEVHFYARTGLDFQFCDDSGEDSSCANACGYYLTCTSVDDHLTYLDMSAACADGIKDSKLMVV